VLLVIDNYDSFTFNLVQYFGQLGVEQRVFRNNEITPDAGLGAQPRPGAPVARAHARPARPA
jgi:anthranilate/para-aminobenzoate synthase component II